MARSGTKRAIPSLRLSRVRSSREFSLGIWWGACFAWIDSRTTRDAASQDADPS